MVDLNKLAAEIHEAALNKGFWSVEDAEEKHLAKMISELGEVVQADRAGIMYEVEHEGAKPEGVVAELADFVMMALDYAAQKEAVVVFVDGYEKLEDHIAYQIKNDERCKTRDDVIALFASVPAYRFAVSTAADFEHVAGPIRTAVGMHNANGYTTHIIALWCSAHGFDLW